MNFVKFYNSLQERLAGVANETEVRDRFCGELYSFYKITFRMERGHSDARLNRLILEFKDKGLFRGKASSAKFKEAYSQLVDKYIPQQAKEDGLSLHDYIGVAIDGLHYAFVFYEENGSHRHTTLLPITSESLLPLIDAISNDERRPFTIENLLADFGPRSVIAKNVINELWKHLNKSLRSRKSGSQKVRMLFQEWAKLFSQATSFGRIGREKIDEHLISLGLTKPLDHTRALFVLHTYNALLFKLIAGELVSSLQHTKYAGFASEVAGSTPEKVRELLEQRIEHAEIFINNGIENFT